MPRPLFPEEPLRPRYLRVKNAVTYGGVGRSHLYKLARKYPGLFRKNGRRTLVDVEILDRILGTLPMAHIGARAA
jgi:hypothetical protein